MDIEANFDRWTSWNQKPDFLMKPHQDFPSW